MVKPSLTQLLEKEHINRYALVVATAKCARDITDEYIREKEYAEKYGIKETDKNANIVNPSYRDERAVQNAIRELYSDEYSIVRETLPEELRGESSDEECACEASDAEDAQ